MAKKKISELVPQDKLIRKRRQEECYDVLAQINPLWYAELTEEQLNELKEWRNKWKDAPSTNVIPEKPSWL